MALTIAGVLVVGGVAAGSYYLWQKSDINKNQTACTMEAKQCADGSYVGRTGSNCEFAKCPNTPIVGNDKDEHGCIGSAGYSWCQEKQKCLRAWEETCTNINSPSPETSATADWQTYKNEQYGFEFKYPSVFKMTNFERQTVTGMEYLGDWVLSGTDSSLAISVTNKKFDFNKIQLPQEEAGFYYKGDSLTKILVGGRDAYITGEGDGGCQGKLIHLAGDNDTTLVISFSECGESMGSKNIADNYRDQILSTFKFTK